MLPCIFTFRMGLSKGKNAQLVFDSVTNLFSMSNFSFWRPPFMSKIEYWTINKMHICFCFSNWPYLLALSEEDWNCGCHWLGALDFIDHVHVPECSDVLLHGSVNSVTAVQGWHDCHGSYPENWHWKSIQVSAVDMKDSFGFCYLL